MTHELALQKALLAHLKGDPALQTLLGVPARIWDAAPPRAASPHLLIGRSESRPVQAAGGGVQHGLTLTIVSKFQGTEEAKAVLAAVRSRLADAQLEADGVRAVNLTATFADVFTGADGVRTFAVLRVRAVTEETGT